MGSAVNNQKSHLEKLGRRILAEANDLKRTPGELANDLGYELTVVKAIISGNADLEVAQKLLSQMCVNYPISLANLWVEEDDTTKGVKIMRAKDSKTTARIFSRKNRSGKEADYYEYRDTVMSRTAAFKPEWIQPIRVVEDDLPNNPDVAYNKGHFLHQCTFFVGEVNFYWEINGKKNCAEMNTGDSNYITPFVPHSFTSRNKDELGLIIAVTFGGEVCNALNEFTQIGAHGIEGMSDNLTNSIQAFKSRLERYLNAESLGKGEFTNRLMKAGMKLDEASLIVGGELLPSPKQIEVVAEVLNLRKQDLLVSALDSEDLVIIKRYQEFDQRTFPDSNRPAYQLKELARTQHLPYLRGLDITVLGNTNEDRSSFCHHLHEYIYNYGNVPIHLSWANNQVELIQPGDSVYIQPMISHSFAVKETTRPGHLAAVRIPGALTDSVINEFSRYPRDRRARTVQENDKWF
jgi:hypothetical protein